MKYALTTLLAQLWPCRLHYLIALCLAHATMGWNIWPHFVRCLEMTSVVWCFYKYSWSEVRSCDSLIGVSFNLISKQWVWSSSVFRAKTSVANFFATHCIFDLFSAFSLNLSSFFIMKSNGCTERPRWITFIYWKMHVVWLTLEKKQWNLIC